MNMIFIMVRLLKNSRIEGGNFEKFPVQIFPKFFCDNRVSVFGRKDEVVITEIHTVIVPDVFLWK